MRHEYYSYTKEELLKFPKIPLICMADNASVFKKMAEQMVEEIVKHNEAGEKTVFICPVGPVGQYPYFVDMVNEQNINLKNVWFINMDEYLDDNKKWVSKEHPLSFRGFMDRTVYTKIKQELVMPENQRVFPDPENLTYIPELIEKLGGVDICFGGIGINGHLAFNEAREDMSAQEFVQLGTRVLFLNPETRTANAIGDRCGAIDAMPKRAVTIGIKQILGARKVRLGVFREWHRSVVRQAAYGEVTAHFPASLLQNHPDAVIYTNAVAAGQPF